MSHDPNDHSPPPGLHLYTRDGFLGDNCAVIRPYMVNEYISASGAHTAKTLMPSDVTAADEEDERALPTQLGHSRSGVTLSVSKRWKATPYVIRNVECDELHFIQAGEFRYVTDFGVLDAGPGDFVRIGRTVTHRIEPKSGRGGLRLILETPEVIRFQTPAPFGMVNFGRDVKHPVVEALEDAGQTEVWLKTFDGCTRIVVPHNPLCCNRIVAGTPPVWKLNLGAIAPLAYPTSGGPPAQFAATPSTDLMFYTLSARPPNGRPPQHHNADYDEIILYFRGPGRYGDMRPGNMIWIPKGVTHWGPNEDVPEGYLAWLLESRGTFRLSSEALAIAEPLETGMLGVHPSASTKA